MSKSVVGTVVVPITTTVVVVVATSTGYNPLYLEENEDRGEKEGEKERERQREGIAAGKRYTRERYAAPIYIYTALRRPFRTWTMSHEPSHGVADDKGYK